MHANYEATYIVYVGTTDAQLLQEHGEVTTRPQVCNPGRGCGGVGMDVLIMVVGLGSGGGCGRGGSGSGCGQ